MGSIMDFLDFNRTPQHLREYHPGCLMQISFVAGYELRPDSGIVTFDASRELYHTLRKHPLSGSRQVSDITHDDFPYRPLWAGLHEYALENEDRVIGCLPVFASELSRLRSDLNNSTLNPSQRTLELSRKVYAISRAYQEEWGRMIRWTKEQTKKDMKRIWDKAPDSLKDVIGFMRNRDLN